MSDFESSFECKGTRGQPPKKNGRGKDVCQLRTIVNRWTKDTKDGLEYFEIQYWEGKNGVYRNCLHIGSEARARYPNQVKEWENKHLEDWKRVYAANGKVFSKNVENLPKGVNPRGEGVGSSRNEGNVDGKEKSMVTAKTFQDQVSVQNKSKRTKTSHSQDESSCMNDSMLRPMIPSSRSNASKPLLSVSDSRPNTSDILTRVLNYRSNLILPPKVPNSRSNGSTLPPKVPSSRSNLMAPPRVPISSFNGSVLPSQVQGSRTNGSKLPLYRPAFLSTNSIPPSRGKMVSRPRKFLPNRNIHRSELVDDEIEDPDQLDQTSNELRVDSTGISINQPHHSVPNRSEDEMDIDVEPTEIDQTRHDRPEADEMDIDVEPLDQTRRERSDDVMDIDGDPHSILLSKTDKLINIKREWVEI
ncbi:hypothetical protein EAF04_008230 [Stromatinia cepivora]|nr:hypothetical protein EAF04_008230 [Stromatinia cepivora]